MKKIVDYRKLLDVQEATELQELKSAYRSLMKTWHPDKFQDSPESKLEAEEKSKTIIEAYHFLVSIAPEMTLVTGPGLKGSNSPRSEYPRRRLGPDA